MSRDRDRRIDADTAERMLAGEYAGFDRLENLLAAAAAPGYIDETAGEEAAVVAFRRARHEPHEVGRHRPTIASRAARLLGVKAAALALAVGATGVALAAGTGVLPNPLDANSRTVDSGSTLKGRTNPSGTDSRGTGSASTAAASAVPMPDPSLVGLCHAYVAEVAANPGKALDNPAFTALITAAGGAEHVAVFCAGLLSENGASSDPGRSGHPIGPPSSHPTGKPTKTAGEGSG